MAESSSKQPPRQPPASAPEGEGGAPSSPRRILVQGAETFLCDQGAGEPILFLHGNPDSSDLWLETMAGLHGCHRCLAPDLPGFGRSALPRGFDFSLPSLARWIAQLLQALGVEGKIHLVVHDLGGPYGLAWAVEHPRRVATAVVINSLFTSRLRWHAWARIWRTPILGELSMALMNRWLFGHELRRGSPDLSDAYLDRVYEHSTPALRRMVLKVYRASDPRIFRGWEEQWAALATTIPVKVLWGMKDPYLPPELAETFGSSDIERLPQVGHWLPAEAPALLVDRLTRFLGGESDAGQTLGQGSA